MKNKIKNIYYLLILSILLPLRMVFAENGDTGVVTQQPLGGEVEIGNPIPGVGSIKDLIDKILEIIIAIGTPIAVLFMIYAGFKFVTARGNTYKISDAREALMWTIVGIVILLGAKLLSEVVGGTITQLGEGIS